MPIVGAHLISKYSYFCDVQHFMITARIMMTLYQDISDFQEFHIISETYTYTYTNTTYRRHSVTSYLTMLPM